MATTDDLKAALIDVAVDAAHNAQTAAGVALQATQQGADPAQAMTMGGPMAIADAAGQTALRAAQIAHELAEALATLEERFPTAPA